MSSELPTRAGLPGTPPARSPQGRFVPGAVLAGRYRIVALLGRGGMGEVYRAEDLKLGQAVALKFLPPAMAADPARLARFFAEARLAREVTHPNVCRVHDVGEVDGQQFLSMEYVDGEDLASLLRRIGRLPVDKGLEIARQICLGLSAAHERGVLHRDLKPANVMIDGRGRARLTDFGLAVLAVEGATGEIAGTPAYMAPEQLAGEAVSVRTDIYALGLVLFEMFTGRPALAAMPTDAGRRRDTPAPIPSALVPELQGAVDRVVQRCLEKDPARRPPSALAVAAALPGGDPLAAMVAAGETPPPEMVAAAGERAAVRPALAWAALAIVIVGMPLAVWLIEPFVVLRQVPLEKGPEVLADRARELARRLGAPPGAHRAFGFRYAAAVDAPAAGDQPGHSPIVFWYRQAPRPLQALGASGLVSLADPPSTEPGMTSVVVDTSGRLVSFQTVPGGEAREAPPAEALLSEAGIDPARMRGIAPGAAGISGDQREAWESTEGDMRSAVNVDAVRRDGRLLSFAVAPGGAAPAAAARGPNVFQNAFVAAYAITLAFALVLARRNLRLGRGDRRGATRLAAAALVARLAAWLLQTPHTILLPREQALFINGLGRAVYNAGLVWLLYMAIEPTVRRYWPGSLISWTRAVAGRGRDPRVGRDVLAGCATAVLLIVVWGVVQRAASGFGAPVTPRLKVNLDFLLGARPFVGWLVFNFVNAVVGALFVVASFVALRIVLRSTPRAAVAATLLFAVLSGAATEIAGPVDVVLALIASAVTVALLLRFGFLATVVQTFMITGGQLQIPATLDLGAWYAQATLAWLVAGAAIAIYGFAVAQRGQALGGVLRED